MILNVCIQQFSWGTTSISQGQGHLLPQRGERYQSGKIYVLEENAKREGWVPPTKNAFGVTLLVVMWKESLLKYNLVGKIISDNII